MRLVKKINNNVALGVCDNGDEIFVSGRGIGFGKFPVEIEDDSELIERKYYPIKNSKIIPMLDNIDDKMLTVCQKIMEMGEEILRADLNPSIVFTLSDHISYALERNKDNLEVNNPLQYEISHMYPNETKAAEEALKIINEAYEVKLPKTEIGFITLHFVNSQFGAGDMSSSAMLTDIISSITSIVKIHFKMDFDLSSINYTRFVTHIRYFVMRQINKAELGNSNSELLEVLKKDYQEAYLCVLKIQKYLYQNYEWIIGDDEMLYLMLHIRRLTSR